MSSNAPVRLTRGHLCRYRRRTKECCAGRASCGVDVRRQLPLAVTSLPNVTGHLQQIAIDLPQLRSNTAPKVGRVLAVNYSERLGFLFATHAFAEEEDR